MPDNPTIWIVAIIAGALVVLLALWKGQFVDVELNPLRLRFKRGAAGAAGVSVAKGIDVEASKVGDIAGVKGTAPEGNVSVAEGARIKGSTVGNIVGIEQGGGEKKP
jgi:hypothetical protein